MISSDPLSQQSATEYVSTVMAATPVQVNNADQALIDHLSGASIDSPNLMKSVRKRGAGELNSDSDDESLLVGVKKHKQNDSVADRGAAEGYSLLVDMIQELSANVKDISVRLERRIGEIEGNVEKRLSVKFNTVITDRVHNEVSKAKAEITATVTAELHKVKDNVKALESACVGKQSENVAHAQSVVVKNLERDPREESEPGLLKSRIIAMFRDNLKVRDIRVKQVTRKVNTESRRPGIVRVEVGSVEEKRAVRRAKKNLKNSSKYSNVYIESDLPYEIRVANENNRRLLKVLGRDKDYAVVSGRIVQRHSSSGSTAEEHTDRNDGRQTERTWGKNARNSSQRRSYGRQPRTY